MKRVIAVLDKNKDGSISFLEFVQGLNALSAGSTQEEKLRFAFQIYDINNDGFISNGELFHVLKMMVGNNLSDVQLQQLVDRTIIKADKDLDGKISFEEFADMVKDLDVIDKLTIQYWARPVHQSNHHPVVVSKFWKTKSSHKINHLTKWNLFY